MIRVFTNSLGSSDWVTVRIVGRDGYETITEGHRISPMDLVMILQNAGVKAELVEVTDEQLEEGTY